MKRQRPGRSLPWRARGVVAALLLLVTLAAPGAARALDPAERAERRGARFAVLTGYALLSAGWVGATYLLRDNFAGRSLAVSAAGWGGAVVVGGTVGGLLSLRDCAGEQCQEQDAVAIALAGLAGAVAGSIVGYVAAREEGMPRVATAAAGVAPFLVFMTAVTLVQW